VFERRLGGVIERYRDGGFSPGTWPSQPLKGDGTHQPPERTSTRRAGCIERCSSGSREAHASKPDSRRIGVGTICVFYPMGYVPPSGGDRDSLPHRPERARGSRGDSKRVKIPPEGTGAVLRNCSFNSAGVGTSEPREGPDRAATFGPGTGRNVRPERAQPRKARIHKRLPVNACGDGAEPRTARRDG
jgi:hypothetical protein